MSCKNQSGAGLKELKKGMKKLFKKKPKIPTPTKFAYAVRNLDHKKVAELIKKGADVNAKYRGRKPLQYLGDVSVDTYGLNWTRVMELLINAGSVINQVTYDEYVEMAEFRRDHIENSVFIDAAEDDDEEIHDEYDIDSLEAYEVLIELYKKEQQKRKKAIKKGIKAKKGFEVGIGDIIGKMVAGAAQKKKKRVKKNKAKKAKKAKKCKKSCKCKNCKCKNCKC